jgi:hypothetical protein
LFAIGVVKRLLGWAAGKNDCMVDKLLAGPGDTLSADQPILPFR